jgi:hypothetical protein
MTVTSITVSAKGAPDLSWRKVAETPAELETINRHFSVYNPDLFFEKHHTCFNAVSEKVQIVGLRQIALVVALLVDLLIFAARQIGCLPKPTFPDHPLKIVLRDLGAPEQILKQVWVSVRYQVENLQRLPNQFRRDTRDAKGEYQINPAP